jgi:hypothetical protein
MLELQTRLSAEKGRPRAAAIPCALENEEKTVAKDNASGGWSRRMAATPHLVNRKTGKLLGHALRANPRPLHRKALVRMNCGLLCRCHPTTTTRLQAGVEPCWVREEFFDGGGEWSGQCMVIGLRCPPAHLTRPQRSPHR